MPRFHSRSPLPPLAAAAAVGALLPLLLLWAAVRLARVDLSSPVPPPGDDREATTGTTLALWACAFAPVLAVALASAWRNAGRRTLLWAAVLAAAAVVASRAWIVGLASARFQLDVGDAVEAGALLGLLAALAAARWPVLGYGAAAHAGALWSAALVWPGGHAFAGWAGDVHTTAYAVAEFAALGALAAAASGLARMRGVALVPAIGGALAGPLLAVLSHVVNPNGQQQWDLIARDLAGMAAVIALIASLGYDTVRALRARALV